MREGNITRATAETDIALRLCLDGTGKSNVDTGVGFLDHMLTLFARHGRFDLDVACKGDVYVDDHHSVEDIGICLGMAFSKAIGDARGVKRYGSAIIPMDEALLLCAVDISGRGMLVMDMPVTAQKVGTFDTELVKEFLLAFVRHADVTLHIRKLAGENAHHSIEACFKALGRALDEAAAVQAAYADEIPSTKGVL